MRRDIQSVIDVLGGAALGLSLGQIEKKTGIPKSTVKRIRDQAQAAGVDANRIHELTDGQIRAIFLPARRTVMKFAEPDWEAVYTRHEKPRHAVSLRVAWEDYSRQVAASEQAMSYSTFCRAYEDFKANLPSSLHEVSLAFAWEPGEVAMMDYSGDPLYYTDDQNKRHRAEIFVGVMAYSGLIFCMATPDQTRSSWLQGCQRMLEYFQGVPQYVYLDNSTSLVTKADNYDPKLCQEFTGFAAYYGFTAFAVRPGKARDKALVENAVGICQQRITNRLLNAQFLSLEDVNEGIAPLLEELNNRPLTEKLGTRRELHKEELPVMQPLPEYPYEPSMIEKVLKVRSDYQVRLNNRRFSVPYKYAGKTVKVRLWRQLNLLIVYDLKTGKQIAQHHYEEVGTKQNILIEHMPGNHIEAMRSKDWLIEQLTQVSGVAGELGRVITRNQPLRVARRILSGMLAAARTLGDRLADEVAAEVFKRPAPTFEAFRQEVDRRIGSQTEERQIGRGVRLNVKRTQSNVRGAEYYASRLKAGGSFNPSIEQQKGGKK